jgi:hypothetical protein
MIDPLCFVRVCTGNSAKLRQGKPKSGDCQTSPQHCSNGVKIGGFMDRINKVAKDIYTVTVSLFRIMIPTLIVVKFAQMAGAVDLLTKLAAPIVTIMGLPQDVAIVLTTTALTNPYAGLIVLASTPIAGGLSVAQTTIVASFMLFTHGLPVEAAISRQAGIKPAAVIIIRLSAAFIFGIFLNCIFTVTGTLQMPAVMNLPNFQPDLDLLNWAIDQIKGLIFVFAVIVVLMFFLEILRIIGVERLLRRMMRPVLRFLGMGDQAATIVIVGLTLGLGFGGGLMIKDVKHGNVGPRDAISALILINLFHSVFEDTTVMMLLGPSLFFILIVRGLFSLICAWAFISLINKSKAEWFEKYLVRASAFPNKT